MAVRHILYGNRWRLVLTAIRRSSWAQRVVAGAFVLLGSALAAAMYAFFLRAFNHVVAEPIAGPLIAKYLLESSFLLVFFLGVVSFVSASKRLLFRSEEVTLLSGLPVPAMDLFLYRFNAASFVAAWPVLLIAVPALIAFATVTGGNPVVMVGVAALFSVLIPLTGALLSFLLAYATRAVPQRLVSMGAFAATIGIAIALIRAVAGKRVFTEFFDITSAAQLAGKFEELRRMFGMMPSHPFVELLHAGIPLAATKESLLVAGASLLAAFVLQGIALNALARRAYLPLLQRFREQGFLARPDDAPRHPRRRRFPSFMRWSHGFLFEKELLILLRSPEDLARAGSLLALMALYLLAARGIAQVGGLADEPALYALLVACAFFATGYIAATIAMRFVFPSPSLDGRAAWVQWASPVHTHEFFSWKLFFWSAVMCVVMTVMSVAGALLFQLPVAVGVFFSLASYCAGIGVVAIALGQGAMYPEYGSDDADALSTTPSGLIATAVCMVYLWVLARYVHAFALGYFLKDAIGTMAFFGALIVTIAVVGAYWAIAPRVMDGRELP